VAITSTAISSLPARLVREVLKRGFLLVAALVPTRRSLALVSGGGLEDQLLAVFEEAVAREPDREVAQRLLADVGARIAGRAPVPAAASAGALRSDAP